MEAEKKVKRRIAEKAAVLAMATATTVMPAVAPFISAKPLAEEHAKDEKKTASAPQTKAARGGGELTRLLSQTLNTSTVNDSNVDAVSKKASDEFKQVEMGLRAASVPLLTTWLDLADYHKGKWEQLPEEKKGEARQKADEVFYHYSVRWNGFEEAKKEVADEGQRAFLLHRLSIHNAYLVMRGLGMSSGLAANQDFWSAYNRLVGPAKEFGLLSWRDAHVIPEMMAEQAESDRFERGIRKGEQDASAAGANLQAVRWELERAKQKMGEGESDAAMQLVRDAVKSLQIARSFGAPRHSIREVLSAAVSEKTVAGLLHAAIEERMEAVTGLLAKDVSVPVVRFQEEARQPIPGAVKEEKVVVEAPKPRKLNRDLFVLEELDALAKQASGADSLKDHVGVTTTAAAVFHGLLQEILGEKDYEWIRELYVSKLPTKQKKDALGKFVLLGSSVLTSPEVREELVRSGKIREVAGQLAIVDSAELWADIGDLWMERAEKAWRKASNSRGIKEKLIALNESMQSLRNAQASYVQASWRFLEEEVPSVIHLNIGACAQQMLAIREAVLGGNNVSDPKMVEVAEAMLSDKEALAMASVVEEAYGKVVERGPHGTAKQGAPQEEFDKNYVYYATALARLAKFKQSMGMEAEAGKLLKDLDKIPPANGHQYYARGVVRQMVLSDLEGARKDFDGVLNFTAASDDLRAQETKRLALENLREIDKLLAQETERALKEAQ
ncbi:MAG: hypothetical protein AB1756_00165 [Acidobacteriota bacterium]